MSTLGRYTSSGYIDNRGYKMVYIIVNGKRKPVLEHRYKMEQHLGRKLLPSELVHHKNKTITDNRLCNLSIMTYREHNIEHHKGSSRSIETRNSIAVLANYREEVKRLKSINLELLEALKAEHLRGHGADPYKQCEVCQLIAKSEGK